MSKVTEWLKEHWYYVGGAVLAVIVFIYLSRQSSSGTLSAVGVPAASGTTGGTDTTQGGLNLTSGDLANLPANLLPPNCPSGQVAQPTMVSGGAGMPSFLLGWQCVSAPASTVPPPAPSPAPAPCPPGTHSVTVPLGLASTPGNPAPTGTICVPDIPVQPAPSPVAPWAPTPAPAPAPAPTPAPARMQTVCGWPSWCGSLWGIAQHFYGDGSKWPQIYNANKSLIGSNPNLIHPGQNLVIP